MSPQLWEEPACQYGYTADQIERIMGTRLEAFWRWHQGQTGAICDGRVWIAMAQSYAPSGCGPHGPVVYPIDVSRFMEGRPNDD